MTSNLFRITQSLRAILRPIGLERLPWVRPFYHRFKNSLKGTAADIEGFRLQLDANDSLDLSLSSDYERFERSLVHKWVKEGNVALDVGAHIGLFTLIMSRQVGSEGRVFAFEPCPETYRILLKNIEANGCGNVSPFNAAVSDRTGKTRLYLNPKNSGDHRIEDSNEANGSIEIESFSLDECPALNETRIDFIKMDIQGAEWRALQGMSSILDSNPSIRILFEFWPQGLENAGCVPSDVLKHLRQKGFRLFHLEDCGERIVEIAVGADNTWYREWAHGLGNQTERHTNLLAVGREGESPV